MNIRGNRFFQNFILSTWAAGACVSTLLYKWFTAIGQVLLPDEAVALLQFPPHLGQRPDLFAVQLAGPCSCTVEVSLEGCRNE